jgi:hypothetical protein
MARMTACALASPPRGAGAAETTPAPAPYGCLGIGKALPAIKPGAATPNTFRTRSS